jgi:hypothetical protein
MTLHSNADLRLLNGLLQVSFAFLPLFPVFNCAQLNIREKIKSNLVIPSSGDEASTQKIKTAGFTETLTTGCQTTRCLSQKILVFKHKIWVSRRVRKNAKIGYTMRHVRPSVCLSARNISAPTEWIFMIFNIWDFFKDLSKNFNLH